MARKKVTNPFVAGISSLTGGEPRTSDKKLREALDVRRKSKKPGTPITQADLLARTGATARSGYDPISDRAIRALGRITGNDQLVRNLRDIDENLLGIGDAERSAFNIGRGEGGGWDAANIALALPMAGLVDKPISLAAKAVGRAGKPLASKAGSTAAGRYLTEARPLVDEAADTVEGAFSVRPAQLGAPKVRGARPVPPVAAERLQLPAPEQRLGLPAPGPGLPEFAAKPRGGQWWTGDSPYAALNPAEAAKQAVYLGQRFSSEPRDKALVDWFDKALPRYLQNDFATPDDPLRALADQGYIPGIENAMQWSGAAKKDVLPFPMQKLLFDEKTAEIGVRDEALAAMPWLNKIPATDSVYGVFPRDTTKGVYSHVKDELANALNPEASGLPADLAVRPESLARMSFPQAVERVGRINQWRAKQAEQAQLSALNSPAVQMFKEYPDDPRGLRWVQLRAPDIDKSRIAELEARLSSPQPGDDIMALMQEMRDLSEQGAQVRGPLQEALKYEGDVMGHCVGGYCDDVLQGRSNIYSLRDAKGEPHVTIETAPSSRLYSDVVRAVGDKQASEWLDEGISLADMVARANITRPENIVQIKGKQNLAPKEDYLPYVQDFVKSGKWGEIGDFDNTGLVKLPDGRYITKQQFGEGLGKAREVHFGLSPQDFMYDTRDNPEAWAAYAPYFEGYARGGRVRSLAAKPCSCDKSLAVR